MTLRERKKLFISKLVEKMNDKNAVPCFFNIEKVIKGVGLAIDCLIENEANERDKTIIFVSYGDENKEAAKILKEFCLEQYPTACKNSFDYEILNLPNNSVEAALLKLVDISRNSSSMLYWADSLNWFKKLPSDTMHVIDFNPSEVVRGVNKQDQESITVNNKSYNQDNVNEEYFGLINAHPILRDSLEGSLADLFFEEAQSLIIRPIPAPIGCKYDDSITINSPAWQKEACVALRRYQGKECKDGFKWDTSNDAWKDVVVYPIVENIRMIDSLETRQCLIGQVTMVTPNDADAYLSTAWLHPFYRREGKLSCLYQGLANIYGNFQVEQPNTNMQAFIVKNKSKLDVG